jgi:hypothetical protein
MTLRNQGVIDPSTSALLDDIRVVGNTAAHNAGTEFSIEDARRFKRLADDVVARLSILGLSSEENG